MTGTEPIFTKLALLRQLFVRNYYTVFHEHAKNGLSAKGMSFIDGPVDSRCGLYTKRSFLLLQECQKIIRVGTYLSENTVSLLRHMRFAHWCLLKFKSCGMLRHFDW